MNIRLNFSKRNNSIINIKEKKILEIIQEDENKKCFDCQSLNILYISLFNGIFICPKCYNDFHKNLGQDISLVLKNNLINLSLEEIQYLYYGGNKKLSDFINYEYPNLQYINKTRLYLTKAMDFYRRWLKYLIYAGEKPIKPSLEESTQLINNANFNNSIKNNKIKDRGNIINIDFINNYYNLDNTNNKIYKKINPNIYKKIVKTNFNNLNFSQKYDFSTLENENFTNYIKTDNNMTERNNFDIENYKKETEFNNKSININKNYFDLGKFNKDTNKLITKRLSLKNKNLFKNKNKTKTRRIDNNDNIINKSLMNNLNKSNEKIYIKPNKQTLMSSFKKNVPSRNRLQNLSYIGNSAIYPYENNNYETNLINYNNTFDKSFRNNFTDRAGNNKENTQYEPSDKLFKTMRLLHLSNSNNIIHKKEIKIFKKKNLINSFSINKRKGKNIKHKTNNSNIINYISGRNNFQIMPEKINDNLSNKNNHIKIISCVNNYNDGLDENKTGQEIIGEIKVKRREKFIIEENLFNKTSNDYKSHRSLKSEDFSSNKINIKNEIANNSSKIKKGNKIKNLLTLTNSNKKNEKLKIPKLNINANNSFIKELNTKMFETATERDNPFEKFKSIFLLIKNKKRQNINQKEKENYLKQIKEKSKNIFQKENNNKSNNNLRDELNLKTQNNESINRYLNQEKVFNNYQGYKTQREKEY